MRMLPHFFMSAVRLPNQKDRLLAQCCSDKHFFD